MAARPGDESGAWSTNLVLMNTSIRLIQGDITKVIADVIVNAANSALAGGGGVDGAIHRAGGPSIMEECNIIRQREGGCKTGNAVITNAGKLKAKYVAHAVGPVWAGGFSNEEQLLRSAYRNSFLLAIHHGAESIAFPNISTGVYGYPKRAAAEAAVSEIQRLVKEYPSFKEVIFVCYDDENFSIYEELIGITNA